MASLLHWDGKGIPPFGPEARRIEREIEAKGKRLGKVPLAHGVQEDGQGGYRVWVIWGDRPANPARKGGRQ
jgi:hypothetical protein